MHVKRDFQMNWCENSKISRNGSVVRSLVDDLTNAAVESDSVHSNIQDWLAYLGEDC